MQEPQFKVIAYASTAFSGAQHRYSTIERELVAIQWGVKTFRAFLFGKQFALHTDHQPLVYLHNMKLMDHGLARTFEDLADFDFQINYTPGRKNEAADAMSRTNEDNPTVLESLPLDGTLLAGLRVIDLVPGGGDSMLQSLIASYQRLSDHVSDNLMEIPDTKCSERSASSYLEHKTLLSMDLELENKPGSY